MPKIKSSVARDLPALLLISLIAAPLFGFGILAFLPAIIAAEWFATGDTHSLKSLVAEPGAVLAVLATSIWLLVYWQALRTEKPWFRPFVMLTSAALFTAWAGLAVRAGAAVTLLVAGLAFLVGAPYWYLYRKSSVATYFNSPETGNEKAA